MIRKIHLDFHTHPDTRGIGQDFDPERFADTLAASGVNYLATPGKCHFGNIYYANEAGRTHPHLLAPSMFPDTVAACLKRGIRVQAYWTLGLDSYAAQQHPDWRQILADGTPAAWGHYLHMCFASPYVEQQVIPEIRECMARCPGLEGFWFDICLYVDGAFYSPGFNQAAEARLGARAADQEARWWLARDIIREQCARLDAAIREAIPHADNYFNSLGVPGEPGNLHMQRLQEVENPFVFGGPEKMSSHARWMRGQDAPTIGLVSRFQGPWSDPGTLRTADQMRFDVARTVALGLEVSMGDHRRPDGSLEPAVYRQLAPIYENLARLEPVLEGAVPCREAVLLADLESGTGKGLIFPNLAPASKQASRLLEEAGLQFDVRSVADPLPADTSLVIWPGDYAGDPELMARLAAHVARGGALLAFGAALDSPGAAELFGCEFIGATDQGEGQVRDQAAATDAEEASQDAATLASIGHVAGAATGAGDGQEGVLTDPFLRPRTALADPSFALGLTQPTRAIRAQPQAGNADGEITVLADHCEPVSAKPPFPALHPAGPMVVQRGRRIYSAASLFAEAATSGAAMPAALIAALCTRLLPGGPLVEHDAGPTVAAHLYKVAHGYVLHLVHWSLERWDKQPHPSARFPMLGPIEVTVRTSAATPSITLAPQGTALEIIGGPTENGLAESPFTVSFIVPRLHIWQVIHLQME